MNLVSAELSAGQFEQISRMVYAKCGISLRVGKEALVRARLMKRLRALKIGTVAEYLTLLSSEAGRHEIGTLIDVMTTNKTSFFRESAHFDFLAETVIPALASQRIRFWSAACSSGEEPYTLAMVLRETLPQIDQRDVLILATDISKRMLEIARRAIYSAERVADITRPLLQKYFVKIQSASTSNYKVGADLQRMVRLGWLNLMHPWPMKGPFEVIFCRNVMIYFDRSTQQELVDRFWDLLAPGGYLFVGHSEGLSGVRHDFNYVKPAIYQK